MNNLSWKTCIRVGVTVVLVYLACTYWHSLAGVLGVALSAASPLIIGAVIAYVANILMTFYERHFFVKSKKPIYGKIRRPACMALAFLTAVAVVVWMFSTVLPELTRCVEMTVEAGGMAPIFMSANVDGGDAHNKTMLAQYKNHIFYMGH